MVNNKSERMSMKRLLKHKPVVGISLVLGLVFGGFLVVSVYNAWYEFGKDSGVIIAQDVAQLAQIFERIDRTAGILSFDRTKNVIDFLNIKKGGFVGSEVGALNLKHPDRWEGPYIDKNPTIQNQEYVVLVTKKGNFIVPADGVKLPSGRIIGKDLILDESSDITALMNDPQGLQFQGRALASPMP